MARGAVAGDRAAWAEIYDRYADRLHDYCYSILRDRQESADALHEAFLTAATKIGQLRNPEGLRPWLYGICRTHALAMARPRSQELPSEDVANQIRRPVAGLEGSEYEARELRPLVAEAVGGLAPRDRAVLDLCLRHGLNSEELGQVLGVSPHHATALLSRVRERAERSLSALLVAWSGRGDCAHLNGLLVDWDGSIASQLPKRVVRHIDTCGVCGMRRKRMVSPLSLLSGVPLMPAPPELREPVLDGVEMRSSKQSLVVAGADEGAVGAEDEKERRWPAAIAGVLAAMIVIGALVFAIFRPGQQPAGQQSTDSPPVASTSSASSGPSSLASVVGSLPTLTVPTTTSTTAAPTTTSRTTTTTTVTEDNQPPEILNVSTDQRQISFREDSSCSTAEATARVTDQSSLEDVVLVWQTASGDSTRTPMSPRPGNRFTATIGPVQAINDGPIRWWVIATDSGGSSSQSSQQSVQVAATC